MTLTPPCNLGRGMGAQAAAGVHTLGLNQKRELPHLPATRMAWPMWGTPALAS